MQKIQIETHSLTKKYKLYKSNIDRLKEALSAKGKKYHKDFFALKDVNLKISKGESIGIVGRNGSGKSTLLKLLAGELNPTSGYSYVRGKIAAILELGAGLNSELTGLENIRVVSAFNGLGRNEINRAIGYIKDFAELGDHIAQPVKSYSSGMRARLAFAIAISSEPEILIVDEALSVGDAAFKRKCYARIEELRKRGVTLLYVSHSESSILNLCDRVIWLSSGSVVLDGNARNVMKLYSKYIMAGVTDHDMILKEFKSLSAVGRSSLNDNSSYSPAIKSKTSLHYDSNGALISNVRVVDIAGNVVNMIGYGHDYILMYDVVFTVDHEDARCAMSFRDEKGNILSGHVYPDKNSYFKPEINKKLTVKFYFKNIFNVESIFVSCGVRGFFNNEWSFLHRIVDAIMIKNIELDQSATGPVVLVEMADLVTDGRIE
jgi:lipopolysaccharide transport system ATP-binding protein